MSTRPQDLPVRWGNRAPDCVTGWRIDMPHRTRHFSPQGADRDRPV